MNGPEDDNGYTAERKDSDDDIERLKKELVDDQAQNVSSNNDYASLKAELDSKIPDRDYAEYVIETIKRTVKQEDSLVRQIFYTGISKDTTDPVNLAIMAPTSEGKTYAALETVQYFPKQHIWKIGSMTSKVIIRQNGILIDSNNQPIADRIKELKRRIEIPNNGDEKEDLKEQLRQLSDEAKVVIDLRGQLWVFLEPPEKKIWDILKPILSHDDFEIEHPYVYEVQSIGFKVKKVVTRGWPACIFCTAKNESDWPVWPEIQSRFHVTSPNMIQKKYRDGNILIGQRMGLPSLMQQATIVSDSQLELAKKCVFHLLEQVKQRNSIGTNPVWIPYHGILAQILPAEKGTDNRITKRILSFLRIITQVRAHLRCRLEYDSQSLAITDIDEDLHEVLHITQNLTGIPPYKLKLFKEVFLPEYKSKQCPNESTDNSKQERVIAVTTTELCEAYRKKTGKAISSNNLKQNYLNEFISNGLIDEEDSIVDKRYKIYYPLIDLPTTDQGSYEKIKILSIPDRMDNILQHSLISVPENCIKFPDNWLQLQILDLIKYPLNLSKFELYNKQGERICLCKFIKQYEQGDEKEYPKRSKLNGYFSKSIFCNSHHKIFGDIVSVSTSDLDECMKLSIPDQMDDIFISDMTKTRDETSEKVAEEETITSTHPVAVYGLAKDDVEDAISSKVNCTSEVNVEKYDGELEIVASDTPDTTDDSSKVLAIANNKHVEKVSLIIPAAARVLTNDDLEDIEIGDNSSGDTRS